MIESFTKYSLERGGSIVSLQPKKESVKGEVFCNPSIINDNGTLVVSLRGVNYLLHHNRSLRWNSAYGPVCYEHPDNDPALRTENYVCTLNEDNTLDEDTLHKIEYMPYEPLWSFVGEEDCRLVNWDDKLSLVGCRRDVDDKGTSRMEISEIEDWKEVSRMRMPTIGESVYCEKNWMPIMDEPYRFVRSTNPLEVVEYDKESGTLDVVLSKKENTTLGFLRGSSQVVSVGDYRVAIVHETQLFQTQYKEKSAVYVHRFVVWDKNWDVVLISIPFSFMSFDIEFCCGMAYKDKKFYIPFSVYDNAPYMLVVDENVLFNFIKGERCGGKEINVTDNLLRYIATGNEEALYNIGLENIMEGHYGVAHAFFLHCADLCAGNKGRFLRLGYDAFYMAMKCLMYKKGRIRKVARMMPQLIDWDSSRYEAYYELSKIYYGNEEHLDDPYSAMAYARLAMDCASRCVLPLYGCVCDQRETLQEIELQYCVCAIRCSKRYEYEERIAWLGKHGCESVKKELDKFFINNKNNEN